jgi:hypothetical protein
MFTSRLTLAVFCLGLASITDDVRAAHSSKSESGFEQHAYIKSSNPDSFDQFGLSVAISSDTMVVGAFGEKSKATGINGDQNDNSLVKAGAAYVFVREGGIWSQQAYLKASNTDIDDHFGYSVAIDGDTIVVGAYAEDSSATGINGDEGNQGDGIGFDAGAAYVFVRNGTVWSQQTYLKASNTGADDRFGYSVAVSADTIVVGAYKEDSDTLGINGDQTNDSSNDAGAVYVFTRNGTEWRQQAYLKASNTDDQDWFGHSVDISGDSVVVGARFEDSSATGVNGEQDDNTKFNSGATYIFARSSDQWSQQAYLKASHGQGGDEFGHSVAISGDSVAVGAISEGSSATGINGDQEDNAAYSSGAVYVFFRNDTSWHQQAYIKASNTNHDDEFGWSVDLSGDRLAVGAISEASNATGIDGDQLNNLASFAGAAYAFIRNGSTWSQQAYLKASNTEQGDGFGWSVSISRNSVAIGAAGEDSGASGINGDQTDNSKGVVGAVYVFDDLSAKQNFSINSGLNDAWYNPETDGQGFFITVFPDLDAVSLAWFTYDTELPAGDATVNLGDPGHRWLTAVGPITGNQAIMEIEMTSGGLFDTSTLIDRTDPPGSDGTIILTFTSCNSATVEYDIPSINRQGIVPIRRVADDNIVICEALSTE